MEPAQDTASLRLCYNNKCCVLADVYIGRFTTFISDLFTEFKGGNSEFKTDSIDTNSQQNVDNNVSTSERKLNSADLDKILGLLKGGSLEDSNGEISMDKFLSVLNKNILTKSLNAPLENQNKAQVSFSTEQDKAGKRHRRRKVYGNDITSDEFDDMQFTESRLLELAD